MSEVNVISVKVPQEIRKKMRQVKVNWSEYIRNAIQKKLNEEKVMAASTKLDEIRARSRPVSTEEIVAWIREGRER